MADGEINVNVSSSGTQDALDNIAEKSAEGGDSASAGLGGGGKKGGGIGGMLGGISGKLVAILGVLGFLASLKPIQELLSGIQRLFSVAILPLVALLNALLRPVLTKLLKFIGNLDFDNLVEDLTTKLDNILGETLESLLGQLPFVSEQGAEEGSEGIREGVQTFAKNPVLPALGGIGLGAAIGLETGRNVVEERRNEQEGGQQNNQSSPPQVNSQTGIDFFREQSNTTIDKKNANRTNREIIFGGEGGLIR